MAAPATRSNDTLLRYLSSAALAAVAWVALRAMPFYPEWLELVLAAGIGALMLASPSVTSLVFVFVLALPVIAADFVSGMLVLIAALVATQYLSMGRAGAFVLAAVALALLPLHGALAAVAVAGYLLGRSRGATVGAFVAATAVVLGVLLGAPTSGVLVTGGSAPVLTLLTPPAEPLAFGWLVEGLKSADAATLFKAFASTDTPVLVVAQIALWALAGAAGSFVRKARARWVPLAATGGVVVAMGAGQLALDLAFAGPLETADVLTAVAISLPLALAATAAAIWIFPRRTMRASTVVPEQRDVDDLLRVIASAEDELAARHNTEAVVMITDMKSFSRMTEEDGSMLSAKAVQKHRDLLLPVIHRLGGHGKSTGGDGLVAAFEDPASAILAAAEMQRAIAAHNDNHPDEREMSVRVGIADGEVVLDRGGRPFIGSALNLAARVMNLADGGQVFATGSVVAAAAAAVHTHAHGPFELKNIAKPVEVVEILWAENQQPEDPRTRTVA